MRRPLLLLYALYSEWLVAEQNQLYNRALGFRSFRTWAPVDFGSRVVCSKANARTCGRSS